MKCAQYVALAFWKYYRRYFDEFALWFWKCANFCSEKKEKYVNFFCVLIDVFYVTWYVFHVCCGNPIVGVGTESCWLDAVLALQRWSDSRTLLWYVYLVSVDTDRVSLRYGNESDLFRLLSRWAKIIDIFIIKIFKLCFCEFNLERKGISISIISIWNFDLIYLHHYRLPMGLIRAKFHVKLHLYRNNTIK